MQDACCVGECGMSWQLDFRRELREFDVESLNDFISQLGEFPLDLDGEDEMVWMGDSSGHFSVKSLIELSSQYVHGSFGLLPLVWRSVAPPRVQLFTWCCAKSKILTRMKLRRRDLLGLDGDTKCPLCVEADGTIGHILVSCPVSWRLWSGFLKLMGVSWVSSGTWAGLMEL